MKLNLDTLKVEVLSYLQRQDFAVFHGYSRLADSDSFVSWDTERHPDFREFLDTARQAGVKLVVYHDQVFSSDMLEEARERLELTDISEPERRTIGRQVDEFDPYEGFTCLLELSFDYQGRVYLFHLSAEWYEDFQDLVENIEAAVEEEPPPGGADESMGGYYSTN
jgi:hypothetical protein